jgi:hypothetical protein
MEDERHEKTVSHYDFCTNVTASPTFLRTVGSGLVSLKDKYFSVTK